MPKVVVRAYADALFFVPLNKDRSEGFWARPITRTQYAEARREAMLEAGGDLEIAEAMTALRLLQTHVVDWKGFFAPDGEAVPYSREVMRDLWECDAALFAHLYLCLREIARLGDVDDAKN